MKRQNIVLIESDIAFARAFINEFEGKSSAEIHHYLTFSEAYKNVSDLDPEYIISEYQLSDIQDPSMITELKRRSPFSKIIVISNQTNVYIIEQLYEKGVFKYFRKNDYLINRLEILMSGSNQLDAPSLPASEFV